MQTLENATSVDLDEAIKLGAVDGSFFAETFLPETARQKSPAFHREIDKLLDSQHRMVNILAFRGSAKTTKCRVFTLRRIAYGLSKTVLYISKSEPHAIRSVSWLKGKIEYNNNIRNAFGLVPGSKWQDTEMEITQRTTNQRAWVMAAGIGGSVRGVNRDDWRPDLIVLDDVLDDENCSTAEQREKIENLIYGAVLESLTPASENPQAKMVSLNTCQNKEDYAVKALASPAWASGVFSCWTRKTSNLRLHEQESIWEDRFPTEALRQEKQTAISLNRLSTFLREKELKLVSPEQSTFKIGWLNKYRGTPMTDQMLVCYAIDPVPPPSDKQLEKGLVGKDYEAHVVMGKRGKNIYLLDYALNRGHNPDWSTKTLFEMYRKWQPWKVRVESVAYQRTLLWIFRNAMDVQRIWFPVESWDDRRKKFVRISALGPIANSGRLWVNEKQIEFIEQYTTYPMVAHDDLLDAASAAAAALEDVDMTDEEAFPGMTAIENTGYRPINIQGAP